MGKRKPTAADKVLKSAREDMVLYEERIAHLTNMRTVARQAIFNQHKVKVLSAPGAARESDKAITAGLIDAADYAVCEIDEALFDARLDLSTAYDKYFKALANTDMES
jgi:hypothetical protein